MRILDLFSGAGGAAMGYHLAFPDTEIVGVDICPQPHYPFTFIQADALTFPLEGFDLIHASPPCQFATALRSIHKREHPDLLAPIRERLRGAGVPYVIENVPGAPMIDPVMLCGTMFPGLRVIRHRLFESSLLLPPPPGHGSHDGAFYTPTGHGQPNRRQRSKNPHLSGPGYSQRCRDAMGVQWMNRDELAQAIPPAYTQWVGEQLKMLKVVA